MSLLDYIDKSDVFEVNKYVDSDGNINYEVWTKIADYSYILL